MGCGVKRERTGESVARRPSAPFCPFRRRRHQGLSALPETAGLCCLYWRRFPAFSMRRSRRHFPCHRRSAPDGPRAADWDRGAGGRIRCLLRPLCGEGNRIGTDDPPLKFDNKSYYSMRKIQLEIDKFCRCPVCLPGGRAYVSVSEKIPPALLTIGGNRDKFNHRVSTRMKRVLKTSGRRKQPWRTSFVNCSATARRNCWRW